MCFSREVLKLSLLLSTEPYVPFASFQTSVASVLWVVCSVQIAGLVAVLGIPKVPPLAGAAWIHALHPRQYSDFELRPRLAAQLRTRPSTGYAALVFVFLVVLLLLLLLLC